MSMRDSRRGSPRRDAGRDAENARDVVIERGEACALAFVVHGA
jgi:hypothetical protein